MKTFLFSTLSLWVVFFSQGCGVYMAFTQPEKVDETIFETEGVHRDLVIEKLGAPKISNINPDGSRKDIYEFYEGSETGWKIGRGIFHLGADIVSLGLWEIVATPTEFAIRGDKITAMADLDPQGNQIAFKVLNREEKPLGKIHGEEIENY